MSVAWSSSGRPSRERSERSWRRVTVALSIGAHVAAALGAIAYSFWHVEELQPPRVTVTFVSAASLPPPPPPPPPPLGGGGGPKRPRVVRPKVENVPEVKTPPVVEKPTPVEPPHDTPPPDPHPTNTTAAEGSGSGASTEGGVKGGVAGGVKGGVVGGVVGGQVGAPVPSPKFLPPGMVAKRKLSGAEPDFPAVLRGRGTNFLVVAKICVDVAGNVSSLSLQKRAEPTLDSNVLAALKGWHFQPMMTTNGTAAPFCSFINFEFKSE